jgi:hypothetical protein
VSWWQGANQAHRLIAPIILLTLITVATLIYLLPGSAHDATDARASVPKPSASTPFAASDGLSVPSASPASPPTGTSTVSRPPTKAQILRGVMVRTETARETATSTRTSTSTTTVTRSAKARHCWDFTWQQDAQAAYLANLSDPWGLDGAPGPANGDGLACSTLPADPTRPRSSPADPFVPPAASSTDKTDLVSPPLDYFGVTQDGLLGSPSQLNSTDSGLGKAPSSLGFFAYWNQVYPSDKVTTSWHDGALPVMTWMSTSSDGTSTSNYSFTHILDGDLDAYLYKYAGAIVRANLPVVIRFDHEMNGNWYPWSAGHTDYNNSPAKYVAVWRHVWNIFQSVGANDDVIWLFSPGRVDNIAGLTSVSSISDDYPGDAYVDWVGATVYWRKPTQATDYQSNFGATISQLRAVTQKPLFFAEIGALQTYQGADVSAAKRTWITNTIKGFLADPSVVGFDWFNNVASTADDPGESHDWRFNASPAVLATFKKQISDDRFSSGVLPDK